MAAMPIGNQLIPAADLSADGAMVPYEIQGLTTSPDPRYVIAFLDDDANVDPASPGPANPDLITLDGLGPIEVKLAASGATQQDLVLNAVIPF
jgi:hypothetical protein